MDIKKLIIRFINSIIPKNNKRMLFVSYPDYADNSQAMYEYMAKNNEYDLVWMIKHAPGIYQKLQEKGVKVCNSRELKGIYYLLTSKYIFCTHSEFAEVKSKKQILINLWHGMPLKQLGVLNIAPDNKKELVHCKITGKTNDILIATSKIMKITMSVCFQTDPAKVLITGQPRNDKLFNPNARQILNMLLKIDTGKYAKTIIYLPTFRKNYSPEQKVALKDIQYETDIFKFADYNLDVMDEFLKKHNILLVVKLHPFEEKAYNFAQIKLPDNCKVLTSLNLTDNLVGLYDVLGLFDILATDYSSVYFDYLILDKPVLFVDTDLKNYSTDRGFLFDNYDFWTPGPKVEDLKDFIIETEKILSDQEYFKKERETINSLVNVYRDGNSCERILDILKNNLS